MIKKTVILLFLLSFLSGCGAIVKHFDSTWADDKTVYNKSQPLSPLGVSPELVGEKQKTLQEG
jgi:hypothetical protein